VRVPGPGEPWPYAKMLAWCRANVAMGQWEQHWFPGPQAAGRPQPTHRLSALVLPPMRFAE
jgi:hypothetical protein